MVDIVGRKKTLLDLYNCFVYWKGKIIYETGRVEYGARLYTI